MRQDVIVVDLDRCIGCRGGCQVACKTEHDIALGESRSKLYNMGPTGTYPDLEMYFIPVMCQQCENPSCVNVCPTGACYKDGEDGVIYINKERCIGCESCKGACPYNAIFMNKEMRIMDKCNICMERREIGEKPACVKNCSGKALYYGDINDAESSVSKIIKEAGEENVHSLKNSGNNPKGRFILRNAKWIDILPQEYEQQIKEGYKWKNK